MKSRVLTLALLLPLIGESSLWGQGLTSAETPLAIATVMSDSLVLEWQPAPLESDHAFDHFITPVTNPVFFEDPRALTELRFLFINQLIPENNPVLRGGDFQVYAMQVRVALNERWSFIAVKDGLITLQPDATLHDEQGFADVALGFKYTWLRDPLRTYVSAIGLTYEIDLGSHRVLQGQGDGIWNPFVSAALEIIPGFHYVTNLTFRLPNNTSENSQLFIWSHHWDYQWTERFYPLIEWHWYHWLRSGNQVPFSFEGGDLVNLGSADVAGNDIITLALGFRYKFSEQSQLGFGYEFPITNRRDVLDERLTLDFIVRY
ncbi:MAG: hypothetical protein NZM42_07355 [Gemmatales bacterium]|nr:hypothetical protein [Gemmatales bacterium]MDW8221722.1 hypothetical protein [Gemmatales bacterium]